MNIVKGEGERNATIIQETTEITAEIVESSIIRKAVVLKDSSMIPTRPTFSKEQRNLVIESWHYVERQVAEVI